ncbi:guanylate kinase [Pantoea sp. Mhis]|uniref:guanylate kinase n=1 Tax=Pantoea sp. Mhis TaxID=2576759 RepID=UPI00135B0D22|nr:guanylate kinase [Pantoea sp. Mhis]MXP56663.1 guanylate kinase [Pantoea sp. Mhis]
MSQGTLYIVSAPSGAGKSSLIHALLHSKALCNIQISISHTTRNIRPNEIHGQHYFFISKNEFEIMIAANDFLEYAEVFGYYYGTSRLAAENILNSGSDLFLDIDWQGAQQVRRKISTTCSIFILPPSTKELEYRLRIRDQDSEEVIAHRMQKAIQEMSHYYEYDYLIINEHINLALSELTSIIYAERLRMLRQKVLHNDLIAKLLAI